MATANPISNSSQSIACSSNSISGGLGLGGSLRNNGTASNSHTTTATHYVNGTGSLGRLKYHHKHFNASDEELDYSQLSQSTHLLGRVKSERFLASKPDEDRRRRTIIVEKKNDTYGFTLQSYGIHYKKDQELEMITYVDYVEYDGPAYRAGMREGDVILSINGIDTEKADHKTLVDFIKRSDNRMRMVVLFEDCVRKVDLHMRYMQLQNMLQSKMNELERVCLRERELLEGKWKTHSLPARKKAVTSPTDNAESGVSPTDSELPYYRPTLSTEDVANIVRHQSQQQQHHHQQQTIIPPPAQFMLTYHHYLDPTYQRYVLKPYTASHSSGEYFVSVGGASGSGSGSGNGNADNDGLQRSPSDQHFMLSHTESHSAGDTTASPSGHRGASRSASTAAVTGTAAGAGAAAQPPVPPPRTCEKHKPPKLHQQQQQQQQQQQPQPKTPEKSQKSSKNHCHGHSCNPCIGHFRWKSHEKSSATAGNGNGNVNVNANANANADNVSLDAYDLASPCCDSHCVPTRRRIRHQHKEHVHKHKHRDRERERDGKERPPRPKSQTHLHHHYHGDGELQHQQHQHAAHQQHTHQPQPQPQPQQPHMHHQHTHQQPHQHQHHHQRHPAAAGQAQSQAKSQQPHQHCDSRNGSIRSHYFDLNTGLASHCSLHSCTSSEFAPADSTSYTTSLSTDTLFWDPKSENMSASRQHSTKSRQSYQQPETQSQQQAQQQHAHHHQHQQAHQQAHTHTAGVYQQRYHITATQIQPSQIYPNAAYAVHKPKSWDNLTTKAIGGYGFGYGYLDAVAMKPTVKLQIAQQRHSIPRKNPYGRYSTYTDIENYAPPPSQFVEELTTMTTTTTITAKSTEELIAVPIQQTANICDCLSKQQPQPQQQQQQQQTPTQYNVTTATSQQQQQQQQLSHHNNCQMGYYSHLPRPTVDVGTSTATMASAAASTSAAATATVQTTTLTANNGDISTVSEVTRL